MPNIHALLILDLFMFLGELWDEGNHVVLGMYANNNIWDGEVTKALLEVNIFEAVVSNYGDKSAPATCATNKQGKQIYIICSFSGLTVLKCGFLRFHKSYGFNSDHQLIWADICNRDLYGYPLNVCSVLQRPMWSQMIPASKNNASNGALKRMNVKMLSMLIKPLLHSVRNPKKELICKTIIYLHTSLAKKIQKFKRKLTNLRVSYSIVLNCGQHKHKFIKI